MILEVFDKKSGETVYSNTFEVAKEFTVGRDKNSTIVLESKEVSRRHARIFVVNDTVFIDDLNSSGGTFVNGTPITGSTALTCSDEVIIGIYSVRVNDEKTDEDCKLSDNDSFLNVLEGNQRLYEADVMLLKSRIHNYVLEKLNLSDSSIDDFKSGEMLDTLEDCLSSTLRELRHELPHDIDVDCLQQALLDELIAYGPITPLLKTADISEIMINGADNIFVESAGKLYKTSVRFFNEQHLLSILQRIVEPLGRHVDAASPMVDARLPDGSRVNAVIQPLAISGSSVTIRKFSEKKLTTDDLIAYGSMTNEMGLFLEEAVRSRKNILVSGGTGSGKTTLLNILSQFIPSGERVVTVEDSAELKLSHNNLVSLEARPANIEGKGRVSIRDLVINTLRMRPDRIIVGECRGSEALDMLQAMNTGHDGSLTTCHANNPRDALSRLENMVMMAGFELPSVAIREQISSAIDIIVQQTRMADGSRKVVKITEVTGREGDIILLQDIFSFEQQGFGETGKVVGFHTPTGNIPRFIEKLREAGDLRLDMSVFVPLN